MSDDNQDDLDSMGSDGSTPPPSDTKMKQTKPPLILTTTVKRDVDLEKDKGWDKSR